MRLPLRTLATLLVLSTAFTGALAADCQVDDKYGDDCLICPLGSYTSGGSLNHRTACSLCPPGSRCNGESAVVACGAGRYAAGGASVCSACGSDTEYSAASAAACGACPAGSFTSGGASLVARARLSISHLLSSDRDPHNPHHLLILPTRPHLQWQLRHDGVRCRLLGARGHGSLRGLR